MLGAIAANQQFRGRGFLARILYARPVSKVGHRKTPATPVDPEVEKSYGTTLSELARGMRGWVGDPAVLTLTEAAQQEIQRIEAAVEPTLAGDGELASLADWGAKYVGAVARIAGILHLAEHGADKGPREAVSAQTVLAAARIGEYFKASAINAFAEMGTDQATADAVYLLERIRHLGQDEVSERDLHGSQPAQIQDEGGPEARAGPARRSRLPEPAAHPEAGRSGSSSITALPGSPLHHRSHKSHRRWAMTGFCRFRGFCVTPPSSPARNTAGSFDRTNEQKFDRPVAADTPPSVEMAIDVRPGLPDHGLLVDYQKTGVVPDLRHRAGPEVSARRGQLIEQYTNKKEK